MTPQPLGSPNPTVERIMEMAYQAAEAQADWAMNLASDNLHARAIQNDEALRTQIAAMVEVTEAARLLHEAQDMLEWTKGSVCVQDQIDDARKSRNRAAEKLRTALSALSPNTEQSK